MVMRNDTNNDLQNITLHDENQETQELREVMQFKNSCSSGDRRVFTERHEHHILTPV